MSVNRELPHVLVLPEDDANRQIAIGFQLALDWSVQRRIQVLNPAGGWYRVLDSFESDHVVAMDRNRHRLVVLLIDFDSNIARLEKRQKQDSAPPGAQGFCPGGTDPSRRTQERRARLLRTDWFEDGGGLSRRNRYNVEPRAASAQCGRTQPVTRARSSNPVRIR